MQHTVVSYLHTALWEAKPLLDDSGQLSDATALLPEHILGPVNKSEVVY
jgi:hypothetical protein